MPGAYSRMMGRPKGYRPSPREAAAIADMLFPLKPRRAGAVFDGFTSNLAADRFPLEQLTVPTLVINARDDTSFAPYRFAVKAADPHPRSCARKHRKRRPLVPGARRRRPRSDRRVRPSGDLNRAPPPKPASRCR